MAINIDMFKEDLKQLRIRTNGRCKTPKYRSINVNPNNIKTLLDFDDELCIKNYSKNTRISYLASVVKLLEFIKQKSLKQLEKRDIISFLTKLKEEGIKEGSINTIHSRITNFLLWLNKGKYPACIKDLKPKRNRNIKLPKDIPTEEDVRKLIEVANSERDKAIVSALYESGCRASEFLNIKIKDLQPTEFGFKLIVSGKTGDRTILLINSAPHLRLWLNNHPFKNNLDSYVWVDTYKTRTWNFGKRIAYTGLHKLLIRLGKRAGFYDEERKLWIKKINPHAFRHARLTELAKKVPESILRRIAGWTEDSTMVKTYVHLNNKMVEDVLLDKVYGKKEIEEGVSKTLQPLICIRCKTENPNDAKFCYKCYYPLNEESFQQLEFLKNIIAQILMEAWKQPNPKEALPSIVEQFKKNMK